jgi:hypothetical protein
VSTVFAANCEGEYAEVNVYFAYEVPLQTVGIKTDLGDFGSIFARDAANGEAIYCQENVQLDGFHRCDMHTDNIVFQKQCEAGTTTFNVAEIGAFIYAEAGAWDWISSVSTDGTEQDEYLGLFGNSQSNYGVDGYLWYGSVLDITFITPVPIVGFVSVPAPPTNTE